MTGEAMTVSPSSQTLSEVTSGVNRMNPDLVLLLELQKIDYDIGELERSKEYMPDMMGTLQKEIDNAKAAFTEAEAELATLTARSKTDELELASMQEDLQRYQSQMMSIKTNKEYDALVHEIDALKTRISDKENEILSNQERAEELADSLEALKSNAEQLEATNSEQLVSLQNRIDTVADKVQERDHARQRIVSQVSRATISVYERVRRGKGAQVVVSVRKGACSGCFKTVPPQRLQEIKRGAKIVICDSCGRMLTPEDTD
jgi:predicted  nucleic acid-binding Zn-ribbon protein